MKIDKVLEIAGKYQVILVCLIQVFFMGLFILIKPTVKKHLGITELENKTSSVVLRKILKINDIFNTLEKLNNNAKLECIHLELYRQFIELQLSTIDLQKSHNKEISKDFLFSLKTMNKSFTKISEKIDKLSKIYACDF